MAVVDLVDDGAYAAIDVVLFPGENYGYPNTVKMSAFMRHTDHCASFSVETDSGER